MARPKSEILTDNEFQIMSVLWKKSPLSVAEVLSKLKRRPKPAYTSVLTIMQAMEKKGYVSHIQKSKAYLYLPVLTQNEYQHIEVNRIAKKVFSGKPIDLALNLVKNEHLSKEDIESLKKILEEL